jgi:hypothetical protein
MMGIAAAATIERVGGRRFDLDQTALDRMQVVPRGGGAPTEGHEQAGRAAGAEINQASAIP